MTRLARAIHVSEPEVPPPASVAPFVEAIGAELTVKLLLELGGASAYIADNPKSSALVASAIGVEATRRLADALGPGSRRLPTAKRWIAQVLSAEGWNVAEIARALHVSDVAVRGYLARQADDRQASLFP